MHNVLPKAFVFLDQYNSQILKNNNITIGVIYRNYNKKENKEELIKIANACKKNRNPLFVSNNIKLAIKVKAAGIYVPSFNKTKRFTNLGKKIQIIGSAHNQKEIQEKITQNCSAIFLSPVFNMKKAKKYLGLHKFNYLSHNNNIDIFALGGVSEINFRKLKLLNIKGFAAISLFKKKPAFLKGRFF